jgi:hypothetical protein
MLRDHLGPTSPHAFRTAARHESGMQTIQLIGLPQVRAFPIPKASGLRYHKNFTPICISAADN